MKDETTEEDQFILRWSKQMGRSTGQFYQFILASKNEMAVKAFVDHAIMQIHLITRLVTKPDEDGGVTMRYQRTQLSWPVIHQATSKLSDEEAEMESFYREQTGKELGLNLKTKARRRTPRVRAAELLVLQILDCREGHASWPQALMDQAYDLPKLSKATASAWLDVGCAILEFSKGERWFDHFIVGLCSKPDEAQALCHIKKLEQWATSDGKGCDESFRRKHVKLALETGLLAISRKT